VISITGARDRGRQVSRTNFGRSREKTRSARNMPHSWRKPLWGILHQLPQCIENIECSTRNV